MPITLATSIPSSATADRGLPAGKSFQRSKVSRTRGNSVSSVSSSSVTWRSTSLLPEMSAACSACANATRLASEKSDG